MTENAVGTKTPITRKYLSLSQKQALRRKHKELGGDVTAKQLMADEYGIHITTVRAIVREGTGITRTRPRAADAAPAVQTLTPLTPEQKKATATFYNLLEKANEAGAIVGLRAEVVEG